MIPQDDTYFCIHICYIWVWSLDISKVQQEIDKSCWKKAFIRDNVRGMVSSLKRKKPKKHVNLERDCQSQTFGGLWKGKLLLKYILYPSMHYPCLDY